MASSERVVIAGGGLTAARAAESLRGAGFGGEVVVIAEEPRLPYERPPLSKGYLQGSDASSAVYPLDAAWYREHDVDVRRGTPATGLVPAAHTLQVGDEVVEYDRLLIATGAIPRRFDGPGAGLRGIHTLRRLPDSTRLRTALRRGDRRVVLVGGGWIGLEVAAAARGYGNDVTVVLRDEVPLVAAIGPELGARFRALHEANGVRFVSGAGVGAVRGEGGRARAVVLGTGDEVDADLVVFGIGATPDTRLAASGGLELENGVATDSSFRTSAVDVFAAGDVANVWNRRLGHRLRVEHWANADASGKVVGRILAGEAVEYGEIPYFFTDQYDLGMEYSGYGQLAAGNAPVIRGDLDAGAGDEYVAFWQQDGKVVAGMNVNVWDVNEDVQRLIRSERTVSAAELADPTVPLAALAGPETP
ncbi:NAD(P)/FAD-dependent oxidoreductase [Agromyces intestinalis]|uniref:NAD(P)/FAD-dependent oxidoreductase n=1 Tax=Agromyces intestinalis TaxID=2592652 RepID=A0A5C1YH63_9MICO|nr:FAD-dependent oxidoreductase [Agromyces intestinalis]QEO15321.1 NAD(P)/FAD-dependent oxidoreductase [Agromyces intestinalis]